MKKVAVFPPGSEELCRKCEYGSDHGALRVSTWNVRSSGSRLSGLGTAAFVPGQVKTAAPSEPAMGDGELPSCLELLDHGCRGGTGGDDGTGHGPW